MAGHQLPLVPYDAKGRRLPEGSTARRMWLDLRPGARVRLNPRHNHQNAKQPNTMHVGAKKGQKFQGKELMSTGPGHGTVVRRDDERSAFQLNIEARARSLRPCAPARTRLLCAGTSLRLPDAHV